MLNLPDPLCAHEVVVVEPLDLTEGSWSPEVGPRLTAPLYGTRCTECGAMVDAAPSAVVIGAPVPDAIDVPEPKD